MLHCHRLAVLPAIKIKRKAFVMSKHHEGKTKPFSLLFFVSVIALTLTVLFSLLWLIAPQIWKVQTSASITLLFFVILAVHLLNSFVEFFFHRYVLHAPVVPFLSYFYKQHTLHHSLTRVRLKNISREGTKQEVENLYPILEEEQHEASYFPPYSLFVFTLLATPLLAFLQWVFIEAPLFLGGYSAIAFSLVLYEMLHALEHLPIEKWKPLLDHKVYGKLWKVAYGFHLRHHANIDSNESISGFFGFPIPDLVLGTYKKPDSLFEHRKPGEREWFESPKPLFFIRWLDSLAKKSIERKRISTR